MRMRRTSDQQTGGFVGAAWNRRKVLTAAAAACLGACGGGGGGGGGTVQPTPPVEVAKLLLELKPYLVKPFGQQSDGSTTAYVQQVRLPTSNRVNSVQWWGYHGPDSVGANSDQFEVRLNNAVVRGQLTKELLALQLVKYSLSLEQSTVAVVSLSVANVGNDVEWFWQSAATDSGPHAFDVAYGLVGTSS